MFAFFGVAGYLMYSVWLSCANCPEWSQGPRDGLDTIRAQSENLFCHLLSMNCTSFLRWKPGIGPAGRPGISGAAPAPSNGGVNEPLMMNSPCTRGGADGGGRLSELRSRSPATDKAGEGTDRFLNWAGMSRELGMTNFQVVKRGEIVPRNGNARRMSRRKPRTGVRWIRPTG